MGDELNIRKEMRELGDVMLKMWGDELIEQGYNLTGRLIKSLEYKVTRRSGLWRMDFFVERYGLIRDRGVSASRVPYSRPGRAARSKFIDALVKWVRRRMRIGGKRGRRIAYAVANTMKKEGSPTRGSYRFAKNKRRTGWIEMGVSRNIRELDKLLERLVGRQVEVLVDSIFEDGLRQVA